MNVARRRKLVFLVFILSMLSIALALVLYALRQNISLFYTPTQITGGEVPTNRPIRLGGMVEKGSITREAQGLKVQFKVTDYTHTVTVNYNGILPDLFREEQGIVAEGKLTDTQTFQATRVLAKHDANYMPPEVKAALASKRLQALGTPKFKGISRRTGEVHEPKKNQPVMAYASSAFKKKAKDNS